jgi:predicted SAM-dependent methyltransferase
MPTRNEILLRPLSRSARIVEIGPSYGPIAPKAEGWNTRTMDHANRDQLIAKYRSEPGVDVSRIEEVDFVWTEGMLSSAVPKEEHGSFDAFVASHVIEHTPDLIAFLEAAAILLKPSGVVILAIPDKRYCFDYFQPLSTTGQVLAAHAEERSRHTSTIAFDHFAYLVKEDKTAAWGQHPLRRLTLAYTIEEALNLFSHVGKTKDYVDLHAWHFCPASFELLVLDLARLGVLDWRLEKSTPAEGCEFFAWLRRGGNAEAAALSPDKLASRRLGLLKRTLFETKEQIDWLVAGEQPLAETPADKSLANPEPGNEEITPPLSRRAKLLSNLELKSMQGFEIGPLASPLVSKAESRVFYVDHADRETLCQKYANDPNVDTAKIVSIDAVWGDCTLRECFPSSGPFDYVVASHVIEHVPDMIGWLIEIADVLKIGGYLSLAIPDKRFTFDFLRQTTRLSETVDAYLRGNRRPMPAQIFDYNANAVELDLAAAWNGPADPKTLKHYVTLRYALDRSMEAAREGKYVDAHCWVFTPESFLRLFIDFVDLDLVPHFDCARFYETVPGTNEMITVLRRIKNNGGAGKEDAKKSFLTHLDRALQITLPVK